MALPEHPTQSYARRTRHVALFSPLQSLFITRSPYSIQTELYHYSIMAIQSKPATPHYDDLLEQSQINLQNARTNAVRVRNYDSVKVRRAMAAGLKHSSGKTAYEWQLDTAEALLLGLDTVVVAGTGSGKTIPCMLPFFLPEYSDKVVLVISPLKALQRDQVSHKISTHSTITN